LGFAAAEGQLGGIDPAELVEAAHATAEALVRHGRYGDDAVTARLVALTDEHGIDEVALLWADRPADSLPGALWRLYALRAGIRRQSELLARAFDVGRHRAPVHEAVAGVACPPGPAEVRALADDVLTGAFSGDLVVALDRAAAFCRVVSTGWALLADDVVVATGGPPATEITETIEITETTETTETTDAATTDAATTDAATTDARPRTPRLLTRRAADILRTGSQLSQPLDAGALAPCTEMVHSSTPQLAIFAPDRERPLGATLASVGDTLGSHRASGASPGPMKAATSGRCAVRRSRPTP
jgi:hypothetical protein